MAPGGEAAAAPMLAVANLETYYGPILAIRGVSFDVPEGEFVTILGANGAGKSTILKTICGVVDPQKGSVHFRGEAIHGKDPDAIARMGISLVPEGREVFPFLSVIDNLKMGAYNRRDADGIAADIEQVFDYFPSLRKATRRAAMSLSGGEQQMLAIARGLMSGPRLIILDEPSLGLMPKLVRELFVLIASLRGRGVSILLVEQNVHQSLKIADRAYVLEKGSIALSGTGPELIGNDFVRAAFLGLDQPGSSVSVPR